MLGEKVNLWKPDYAVDVEQIDTQHKKFFDYCSRLIQLADESSVASHTNAELLTLFFKIRSYAFKHFMDEEELMLKYKYHDMVNHIREHNWYYVKIFSHLEDEYRIFNLDISAKMDSESRRIAIFLSEFAAGWLEEHIYTRDKLLAKHLLKAKGQQLS